MKNIFKRFLPALALSFVLASCGEQDAEDYTAGGTDAMETYGEVYFANKNVDVELTPDDAKSYQVTMKRKNTEGSLTVPLEAAGNSDIISVSDAVFADGEETAVVNITFPNAAIATPYSVNITAKDTKYLAPCTFSVVIYKWNLISTGTFTYSMWAEGEDPGLELYQRDDTPNAKTPAICKITHWLYDVDYLFTWDKETNVVEVQDNYIGTNHSSYGPVYAGEGGKSYFNPESNTFFFNNEYFVSAGSFGVGMETFVLDTPIK